VQVADGSSLEPAVQRAINDFIVGCKADGIWSAIKASCILMGARTLSGALTPLVGAAPTNNNFVSGDYSRKTGLKGNASNKTLRSNRANNADGLDDKHGALYVTEHNSPITTFCGLMGAGSNGNGAFNLNTNNASGVGVYQVRHHSNAISSFTDNRQPQAGFYGASRASSASIVMRANGSSETVSTASLQQSSDDLLVFARGFNNSGDANTFSNARIAFYSIGSNLTLSLLDTRASALYTAIGAAIP
jgi:hypothetical protein